MPVTRSVPTSGFRVANGLSACRVRGHRAPRVTGLRVINCLRATDFSGAIKPVNVLLDVVVQGSQHIDLVPEGVAHGVPVRPFGRGGPPPGYRNAPAIP